MATPLPSIGSSRAGPAMGMVQQCMADFNGVLHSGVDFPRLQAGNQLIVEFETANLHTCRRPAGLGECLATGALEHADALALERLRRRAQIRTLTRHQTAA